MGLRDFYQGHGVMAKRRAKANRAVSATNGEPDPITRDLAKYADQYVTTKQAAEMLGVVPDHVNRLLIDGKLRGVKLGYSWLVYKPSIEKYQQTKSKRGRPRSGLSNRVDKNEGQA